ncbi:MAG: hypothetical protein LR011_04480 [Verrucomicrobia bacterium]|nr:hypothetical protein [Verrucomicrobiota bacterium]
MNLNRVNLLISQCRKFYRQADVAWRKLFGRIFFSCRDMSRLASEKLDRPLTCREKLSGSIHLFLCTWCRNYEKQLHFLRNQFLSLKVPSSTPGNGQSLPEDAKKE